MGKRCESPWVSLGIAGLMGWDWAENGYLENFFGKFWDFAAKAK
jgi:hypothetical protein